MGKESLSLNKEIRRVLDILSASILQNDALINIDVLEDINIEFSRSYLESILINLLTNSLKYRHPDRSPDITITACQLNGHTRISIGDNGLGMDLSIHEHKLFGMYKTFHRHPDARGMGLFMVKNQVEAMGGRIRAESEPGISTTFTIEFE